MASTVRPEDLALALSRVRDNFRAEPYTFDFFQAVRMLKLLQPERAAIGEFAHPRDEAVRIGAHASISFPASQIQATDWANGGQPKIRVNFMGLFGPLGVLPLYYTELIIERLQSKDPTLRDFLDIFNHRMTSFFYQAWEKYRFFIGYERAAQDPLTEALYSLVGMGTPNLRGRQSIHDESMIFYGALFALQPRSEIALRSMLGDYFGVPVELEQFVGVWRRLDVNDQCCFETGPPDSARVGFGAVVGDEVWDQQSRVRIRLGPLTAQEYNEFLPGQSRYRALRAITRIYSGNDLEFEVELILRRDHVPNCELGSQEFNGPRLGWFTWMKTKPDFPRDPGDTILLLT